MGVGKAAHLYLRHAGIPTRCARDVPIMTISVVPPGVMAGITRMTGEARLELNDYAAIAAEHNASATSNRRNAYNWTIIIPL